MAAGAGGAAAASHRSANACVARGMQAEGLRRVARPVNAALGLGGVARRLQAEGLLCVARPVNAARGCRDIAV